MPILQDTPGAQVAGRLGLSKDDLIILDRQGRFWKRQHTDNTHWNFYTEPGISTLDAWVRAVP
jgi:hypothetical protein